MLWAVSLLFPTLSKSTENKPLTLTAGFCISAVKENDQEFVTLTK